jgi:hypothetical protein
MRIQDSRVWIFGSHSAALGGGGMAGRGRTGARLCGEIHVSQLSDQIAVLRPAGRDQRQRRELLRWLAHGSCEQLVDRVEPEALRRGGPAVARAAERAGALEDALQNDIGARSDRVETCPSARDLRRRTRRAFVHGRRPQLGGLHVHCASRNGQAELSDCTRAFKQRDDPSSPLLPAGLRRPADWRGARRARSSR